MTPPNSATARASLLERPASSTAHPRDLSLPTGLPQAAAAGASTPTWDTGATTTELRAPTSSGRHATTLLLALLETPTSLPPSNRTVTVTTPLNLEMAPASQVALLACRIALLKALTWLTGPPQVVAAGVSTPRWATGVTTKEPTAPTNFGKHVILRPPALHLLPLVEPLTCNEWVTATIPLSSLTLTVLSIPVLPACWTALLRDLPSPTGLSQADIAGVRTYPQATSVLTMALKHPTSSGKLGE